MKTMVMRTVQIALALGIGLCMLLGLGCRKNEDFIVEQVVPLNLGIRLSVDEVTFEYDAFGRYCEEEEGDLFIVVANNPALLASDVVADELSSGDFVLFRSGTESPEYTLLYVYEWVNDDTPTLYILIGEPDFIGDVVVEADLIQGEVSGVFATFDGELVVPFSVSFTSQLIEDTSLCE